VLCGPSRVLEGGSRATHNADRTPENSYCVAIGTKRTCRERLTISAPEGKTNVPREPRHFRVWPKAVFRSLRLGRFY